MPKMWKLWLTSALVCSSLSSFAKNPPATPAAAAPAGSTAMQTFVCNDGSSVSAATAKGACSGHKGVDKAATEKLAAAAAAKAAPKASTPAAKPAATTAAAGKAAPAPGQVWVNLNSKIYHCQGDRHYGTTKNGQYMSEAEAKAAGMQGAKQKTCS